MLLVLSHFCGPCPYKFQGNHLDGNKANNRIDNLEWVSLADNVKHAWENGLMINRYSKLTSSDVRIIKKMLASSYANGQVTQTKIAELFKVHFATISAIHKERNWKHI